MLLVVAGVFLSLVPLHVFKADYENVAALLVLATIAVAGFVFITRNRRERAAASAARAEVHSAASTYGVGRIGLDVPLRTPEGAPLPPSRDRSAAKVLVLWTIGLYFSAGLVWLIVSSSVPARPVVALTKDLAFFAPGWIALRLAGRKPSQFVWASRFPGAPPLALSAVVGATLFGVRLAIYVWLRGKSLPPSDALYVHLLKQTGFNVLLLVLTAIDFLVVPFCEEFFFRGILLRGFAGTSGAPGGLFISSALFSGLHLWPNLANPLMFANHFVEGLIFGALYLRTRSLWTPIVAHFTNNVIGIAIVLVVSSAR